jgi:hypothetical protein
MSARRHWRRPILRKQARPVRTECRPLTEIPRAGEDDRSRLGLPVRTLSSLARRKQRRFLESGSATAFVGSISRPKGDFANKSFRTPVEVRFTF